MFIVVISSYNIDLPVRPPAELLHPVPANATEKSDEVFKVYMILLGDKRSRIK